jgi:hypothetical protein
MAERNRALTSIRAALRLLAVVLTVSMAAVLITGCVADVPVPKSSDLVGTWIHADGSSKITFYASGKVTFIDVPRGLLMGDLPEGTVPHKGPWSDLVTLTGTWENPKNMGEGYPSILGSLDGVGYKIFVDGDSESSRKVFFPYGDDLEFQYSFKHLAGQVAR